MPISLPRLPFPYPAFILKTAGIYQTVQTRDMAGGLSLYDITANSSPIFFFLTFSVSFSVSGTGTFIFSRNTFSTSATASTNWAGESFRIVSISSAGSLRKFSISSAVNVFNHFINLYLVHRGDNQTY